MSTDETPSNPPKEEEKLNNPIDLSQLQSFSFGTQWVESKSDPSSKNDFSRRPRQDNSRPAMRRDRRDPQARRQPYSQEGAPQQNQGFSRERREDRRGGPRERNQDSRHSGFGERRFDKPRSSPPPPPPYLVTFYPEDNAFETLSKVIRSSCRTYELFEIAKVIIEKNDRFVAQLQHKPSASPEASPSFAISLPDKLPFENEQAAIAHVLEKHMGEFFDMEDVEVDPPKGNFQVINRCMLTNELLAPPNYHRYNQILQQHHSKSIKMPMEAYKSKIESVRDPELINQWLEKMKKTTRYTWKEPVEEGQETPVFDTYEEVRDYLLSNAKGKMVRTMSTLRVHGKLLESISPQSPIRRAIEISLQLQRRFPLDTANALRGRLRREGFTIFKKGSKGISYVCAVKRKFRIPGQTFADSIQSLISFIEANPMVKASQLAPKFLGITIKEKAVPAPTIAEAVKPIEAEAAATEEAQPETINSAEEQKTEVTPAGTEALIDKETKDEPAQEAEPAPTVETPTPSQTSENTESPALTLTEEEQNRLRTMNADLRWLVCEGYVTEFSNGSLFTSPVMPESKKKQSENIEEHDPENFPEMPAEESNKDTVANDADTPVSETLGETQAEDAAQEAVIQETPANAEETPQPAASQEAEEPAEDSPAKEDSEAETPSAL